MYEITTGVKSFLSMLEIAYNYFVMNDYDIYRISCTHLNLYLNTMIYIDFTQTQ